MGWLDAYGLLAQEGWFKTVVPVDRAKEAPLRSILAAATDLIRALHRDAVSPVMPNAHANRRVPAEPVDVLLDNQLGLIPLRNVLC